MIDPIDRNVAIRKLKRMATQAYIDKLNGSAETVINCCIDVIERQIPSAQPEIVRCKDCKYVGTDATCCLVCDREWMGLKPYHVRKDDYCSYAERRTDEGD